MWEEVFNLAVNNGIWAVLFCALLIFQLKDSKEREKKYQKTISELNGSLTVVKEVNKNVAQVKEGVEKVDGKVVSITKKVNKLSGEVGKMNKTIVFASKSAVIPEKSAEVSLMKAELKHEKKFKSYTFWMSLVGAFILILQNLGLAFGFAVNEEVIMNIINSVCGVLVLLGIINNPAKNKTKIEVSDEPGAEVKEEISMEPDMDIGVEQKVIEGVALNVTKTKTPNQTNTEKNV